MKLKNYITVLSLGAALMLPLGCSKDFLNQKDTSNISQDVLFTKPDDGIRLVNAIYDTFDNVDFMLKSLWYQANFLSQDFKNYGSDTFFERYEVPTSFDPLNTFWVRCYQGIARANSAIPIVAQMKAKGIIDDKLANQLTGQAYFLRGLFYYYLASNFGGVPLELQTVTDAGRHPRNTQDEVFASVVADMKTAASLLPSKEEYNADDLGRATKGAAYAYEGAAQMWLKKYSDAVASFNQLDGKYQLMPNYIDVHEFSHQNNAESVFEVQFIVASGADQSWGHSNDSHWLSSFGMPEEVSNFGYAYADKKLYDSFEDGDTRKLATVIGPGDVHPSPAIKISMYPKIIANYTVNGVTMNTCGTVANPWKGADGLRSGYYGTKFWRDPSITGSTGPSNIFSGQNVIMMRYGEVLLSKAEALIKSGNQAAAMDIINNQIRKRAGLGAKTGDATQILLTEYRHELAGEMSLWFDLRRSGEQFNYVKNTYGITIPNGKDLMPIPQTVIANNSTITQNPGY